MKNEKAFTLIELMGVIVLLGVIALITIPIIDKQIKDSKSEIDEANLKSIKSAAQLWFSENPYNLPTSPDTSLFSINELDNSSNITGYTCYINYDTLVSSGYLDADMKNPSNEIPYTSYNTLVKVTKDKDNNKYNYEVMYDANRTSTNNPYEEGVECGDKYSSEESLLVWYDAINNTGNGHDGYATSWYDLSGSGNDGTITGATWSSDYLTFDGNDYVDISSQLDNFPNTNNPNFTVEIVAKAESVQANGAAKIISKRKDAGDNNFFYFVGVPSTTSSKVYFGVGTSVLNIDSIDPKLKHYYAISHQLGTNATIYYIDSNSVGNASPTQVFPYNPVRWIIGAGYGYTSKFKGQVYSVRIYNKALTADEIKHNFELDKQRFGI